MSNEWRAPFTDAQMAALNEYQQSGRFHPYTCGTDRSHPKLVPSRQGWHCVACDYTQDWAHPVPTDLMAALRASLERAKAARSGGSKAERSIQ